MADSKYDPTDSASLGSFRDLPQAIDPSIAQDPIIDAEDTAFADEEFPDETALGIVLTDVQTSIAYLQSKALMPTGIDIADDLIRAYAKPRIWPDGKPKANLPMHVVLEAIEKILPVLYMSLFGSGRKVPFILEPLGNTTPDAARAKSDVLWWAIKQANLKEEMRLTLKTCLSYGFCVGWNGWESKEIRKKVYAKSPDGSMKGTWKEVPMNLPTYSNMPLKNVIFDSACFQQNIQTGAAFVCKQVMINANDLADMREDTEHYKNIPSDEELREILSRKNEPTEDSMAADKRAVWREFQASIDADATSKDPLMQPLEYLEYWTKDRVIGVLQRKIVIRNQANEKRKLPGRSCAFIDILGSAWGFGIARLLAGEQRLQIGVACNWVDSLALVLNPTYQLLKGMGPGTQNIPVSPGKVVNLNGELKPLITPDITGPAMNAIESSEERAAKRVGANGGDMMPKQALRTGAGVTALTGDVIQRLQYFLEIFINNIYIPVLEEFLEDCFDHLQPEQINHILTEEQGKAWEGDITDVYNAQCSVDVIAGANLMARQAAAQLLPMILSTMSTGPVQEALQVAGKKFLFDQLTEQALELFGWDLNTLFADMTPADLQRLQQRNQAMAAGVAQANLQNQKHSDKMDEINEKGTVDAGVNLVKTAVKGNADAAQAELESLNQGSGEEEGEQ